VGFGAAAGSTVGAAANKERKRKKGPPAATVGRGFASPTATPPPASALSRGRRPRLPPKEYPLGPFREVPPDIPRPSYAADGVPKERPPMFGRQIDVKSADDIARMRVSCLMAREVLDLAVRAVRPGVTTDELDRLVHEETVKRGAYPSPLNYHRFPRSVCTSVNEVLCHGIPDPDLALREGDIINIDVTLFLDGFHGDCSEMVFVGKVDESAQRLVKATYEAWQAGIAVCRPGVAYRAIGTAVEAKAREYGCAVSDEFVGHGIGRAFHTAPNVFHYENDHNEGVMKVGHVFTVEPVLAEANAEATKWPDGWTYATIDGSWTAQFEHTLLITETGVEALTRKLPTSMVHSWERPDAY